MNSRLEIKLDKNRNIKTLKTPYDDDTIINSSFKELRKKKRLDALHSQEMHKQFKKIFKGFGDAFLINR